MYCSNNFVSFEWVFNIGILLGLVCYDTAALMKLESFGAVIKNYYKTRTLNYKFKDPLVLHISSSMTSILVNLKNKVLR